MRGLRATVPGCLPSGVRAAALAGALALGACAAGAPVPQSAVAPAADALPTDPALHVGTLDNGLTYAIRRGANPPGRVAIWMHVSTGSLNETEPTRGLAHYLEHMAFNGSTNFPPGSVVPFFESLGLSFGRDQNAFTGLDRTVYTLALPDTKVETLDRGLLFLSDVAFRLQLGAKEIDSERQIILEEKRARSGARQRVQDQVYAKLAPESTIGRRLPIGAEETIRAVGSADFKDFWTRWYVASNVTVLVVGDLEPKAVADAISRHFASAPRRPRPAPRPTGVTSTVGVRGIVATDPELTDADISLTRMAPPAAPITTVAALRRNLVEQLAAGSFDRRLDAELSDGRVAFLSGGASIDRWPGAARITTAQVSAKPDRWRSALADLATSLQRARLHGFRAAEVDEARTSFLAQAEEAAQQDASAPARRILRRLSDAVARREPWMSAEQRLALLRQLLPGITVEEVSRAFSAAFDPQHTLVVLTLPAGGDVPAETDLASVGQVALAVSPDPPAERARPDRLLAAAPRPGTAVEAVSHAGTGVWSAWLDNGVRVHHHALPDRKNEATIWITLAGGTIQERPDERGLSEAAVAAWNRPAGGGRTSTDIRGLMAGKKIRVRGDIGADTVTLSVSGEPGDLEAGLELAHLLLTDPVVEAAGFEQWKAARALEVAARSREPRGVLAEAQAAAFFPAAEARLQPLTEAQLERLTRDATQAWLRALIGRAPIEVAVVGDVDRDRAAALVARYLGSLSPRPRMNDKVLRELRAVPRPTGPIRVTRGVATRTDQAQVLDGFFAADVQNVRDSRLLVMAARVMSVRLNKTIREEKQLVYSIGAGARPGEAYPGFGIFAAQAPTEPAKATALGGALDEMVTAFAAGGPTAEELAVAKRQMATLLDEVTKAPSFWLERLATLDYRGLSLDDIARIAADYQRFTTDEVRETFARYARPEGRFRIVVVPQPPS